MKNDDQQQLSLIKRIIKWINEMEIKNKEDQERQIFNEKIKEMRY